MYVGLSVIACMCTFLCIHECEYMYVYTYVCPCMSACECMYVCMSECMNIYIYMYMCEYLCDVCTCARLCVCTCIHVGVEGSEQENPLL